MRFLDWLATQTTTLGRELADSGPTAVYLRQLLRGNRVRAACADCPAPARPAAPRAAAGQPPVLLVHGYFATRGSLHLLERRLHDKGHVVLSYRLGLMNLGNIRDSAALIARKVEALCAQTSIEKVDLVGHSMGGLVGLYYLKRLGGRHRVRRLVLLGTPIGGSAAALLGLVTAPLGRASLQLLPNSPFLRELNEAPLPPGVEVVSIAGERDHLAPVTSTILGGVRQMALPTCHSGLLVDPTVADAVDEILRAPPSTLPV
jgi:pimeloyl-ACP methyl ester carboxylesterase